MSSISAQSKVRQQFKLKREREVFEFKDGGIAAVDWFKVSESKIVKEEKPIVLIVPGMSETSNGITCQSQAFTALKRGYQPVVMNYRGSWVRL